MPTSTAPKIRIRMYRQGLGDCFLVTFTGTGQEPFNLLIDCGLLQGTTNGKQIMQQVAKDIHATLPQRKIKGVKKKWLDAVALTHEHVDHISGFSQAQDIFDGIHFGQVWAGWLEDEHHPKYKAVRERFKKQLAGLQAALSRMQSEEHRCLREGISALVGEFFDAALLGAGAGPGGRSPAWDYALRKSIDKPKYCSPGDLLSIKGFDDIRIYVLGPPEDYETFTQVDPPDEETYRSEGSGFAVADSFFAALAGDGELFDGELYQPFEKHLRIDRETEARQNAFLRTHYGFGEEDENAWRRIDDDWLATAGSLALNLDTYTNNTCLAFAIEIVSRKKVLLFPGDAQFANWRSWQQLSWDIPDGHGATHKITTAELFKRAVFYKVGHHGSHNATLSKHGLEMMTHPDLMAMIPVDREKAKSKKSKTNPDGWEMPEKNLFARLQEKTRGRVLLADERDDSDLKKRCQDADFIKAIKFLGSFVRDPAASTKSEPLCIELTLQP